VNILNLNTLRYLTILVTSENSRFYCSNVPGAKGRKELETLISTHSYELVTMFASILEACRELVIQNVTISHSAWRSRRLVKEIMVETSEQDLHKEVNMTFTVKSEEARERSADCS
jgi:hypothetical protein